MTDKFNKLAQELDANPTLPSRLDRIVQMLVAVPDNQVPATIKWGSDLLAGLELTHDDGSTEPLFPRHSVHDIRIDDIAYRWSLLPQVFLRLKHNTVAEIVKSTETNPDELAFQSSGALLKGTVFGGLYFAPLLGNLSPGMWGFGAPRLGQIIIYTLGRKIGGRGPGASRDPLDSLQELTHHITSKDFDTTSLDATTLHKAAYSEAVDWWAGRINNAMRDIFSPTTYIDGNGVYVPEAHQRWMLNLEQLLSRISAIARHPRDRAAQLMLMFPAMDILGDSFTGSNGIGQLMTPARIQKRITAIEDRVPDRIRPLIMAPAWRALAAATQVADEFFVPSPNPDATTESRLLQLWNARRNTTHGFNNNAEILAEHTGQLPADIVLVPMVYLLDILTDRQHLLERIRRTCI
ncbi:hypothetical protein IU459_35505 [Nocardia amamiensis]|uniref:ER-bound oxygenase mpaB/mpaB'/Rubber oxygenase catalytic domain-containing protein n=1 Tax=Nocardia amamiensis TaxID=404578 RepID=A0ABS0D1U3_9NOCA|nr:hypothetical protein [Nocardia amamiensis]MBF6302802.1 hypothetical protein [Nocardia amamiensis]